MATSTLNLYYSTQLHEEKRFAIEHIDQWLLGFTADEVKLFQYIKNQLNINIKINMSQNNLETTSTNDIDYVSVKNSNETRVYYYFVKNKIWRSQETIEFELKMDTLNTFQFDVDYEVNKKTLVQREHKDRIKVDSQKILNTKPLSEEAKEELYEYFINSQSASVVEDRIFIMDIKNFIQSTPRESRFLLRTDTDFEYHDYSSLSIAVYDNDGNLIVQYDQITEIEYISDDIVDIKTYLNQHHYYNINQYVFVCAIDSGLDYDTIQFITTGSPSPTWPNPNVAFEYLFINAFLGWDSFKRIIDKYPEGINPLLYKKSEEMLLDKDKNENWYLVYANENDPATGSDKEADYINPVHILFAKDSNYYISSKTASRRIVSPSELPNVVNAGEQLVVASYDYDNGAYVEINGIQYPLSDTLGDSNYHAVRILRQYDTSNTFYRVYIYKMTNANLVDSCITLSNVGEVIFYGVNAGSTGTWLSFDLGFFPTTAPHQGGTLFQIGSAAQTQTYSSSSFDTLDLTLSKLIKVIQLPYAPLKFLSGAGVIYNFPSELVWNNTFDLLQITPDKRFDFSWQIDFPDVNPFKDLWGGGSFTSKIKQARNDNLESKFFNSEFTQIKFVYDQFTFTFQLELIDINKFFEQNYETFYVNYGVSKRLSSRFYFKFEQYICDNYERQDYNNVLLCDRNNEIPLYTNAYINYMRTGFQFDQTNKQNAQVGRWAGIALSAVGAVASFASTAATGGIGIAGGIGLTTSTIAQVVGAITAQNQQENSINQKMLQASMQGQNVQSSDDVELFDQYGENKAKLVKYQPSEVMSKLIKDLFYYGGYATNEYKIPSVDTRVYFNYLQCELVVDHTNNIPEPIMADIIDKFKQGATIFHKFNGEWDIEQQYENYEVSI